MVVMSVTRDGGCGRHCKGSEMGSGHRHRSLLNKMRLWMRKAETGGDVWVSQIIDHILNDTEADIPRVPVTISKIPELVIAILVANARLQLRVLARVEIWCVSQPDGEAYRGLVVLRGGVRLWRGYDRDEDIPCARPEP